MAVSTLITLGEVILNQLKNRNLKKQFNEINERLDRHQVDIAYLLTVAFENNIIAEIHDEIMDFVDEHHQEIGLFEMNRDELLELVDSSEWERLVEGDYMESDDLTHWHGSHIEPGLFYEASYDDLIEFHKYSYYWRLLQNHS